LCSLSEADSYEQKMIDVTYLFCGQPSGSTGHRYGRGNDLLGRKNDLPSSRLRPPVVVWNITRACNLACAHCYSNSDANPAADELTTAEAKKVIDDLAGFGVPVLLFSGGEPLLRPDIFTLLNYAHQKGLKTVLSTNGTLIDESVADMIASACVDYVGISLDSPDPEEHDGFRGRPGAFDRTIHAIPRLKNRNQKVGLRITLTKTNASRIEEIFALAQKIDIPRICFYHLVPAGRGAKDVALTPPETRTAVEKILAATQAALRAGRKIEVLTVDGHYDGPFIYLKLKQSGGPRAEDAYSLLKWNGGALGSSGAGIACLDWSGRLHPDQFWMDHDLGNIREKSFADLWKNNPDPLLLQLRNRADLITGRCKTCRFFSLCGGGLRARAKQLTANPWAPDPGCYLTDEEIK
jgi:Fe-coproporphyrin III synthase